MSSRTQLKKMLPGVKQTLTVPVSETYKAELTQLIRLALLVFFNVQNHVEYLEHVTRCISSFDEDLNKASLDTNEFLDTQMTTNHLFVQIWEVPSLFIRHANFLRRQMDDTDRRQSARQKQSIQKKTWREFLKS